MIACDVSPVAMFDNHLLSLLQNSTLLHFVWLSFFPGIHIFSFFFVASFLLADALGRYTEPHCSNRIVGPSENITVSLNAMTELLSHLNTSA